ncbi:cyclin-dependent kinase inhibitor far1 [Phlyctochytrium bullatum]|nr:cyclin-dependent kinase inhibitor far1 [Phlyctochytrium bullatum]
MTATTANYDGCVSPMHSFYRNKKVFVTGATGFYGEVVLYTLLQFEVAAVYCLVRNDGASRLACRHDARVIPVEGHLSKPNFGLDPSALPSSIDVFFHIAADVRFLGDPEELFDANVVGTYCAAEFALKTAKVQMFAHVSTFGVGQGLPLGSVVEERIYPSSNEANERSINPYVFTKGTAERLLNDVFATNLLPHQQVFVARVPGLAHSVRTPYPGFIKKVSPVGVGFYAERAPKGIRPGFTTDIVPVDMCANMLLAHLAYAPQPRAEALTVLNLTAGPHAPYYHQLMDERHNVAKRVPGEALDAAYANIVERHVMHDNTKTRELAKRMTPADTEAFPVDVSTLVWFDYFQMHKRVALERMEQRKREKEVYFYCLVRNDGSSRLACHDDPRVIPVEGHLSKPKFGLDPGVLAANIDVFFFFHIAADVRFVANPKELFDANVVGTFCAADFALRTLKVQTFAYVLTFAVGQGLPLGSVFEERIYPVSNVANERSINPYGTAERLLNNVFAPTLLPHQQVSVTRVPTLAHALRTPYPGFIKKVSPASVVFHAARPPTGMRPAVTLAMVPVDMCANMLLAHVAYAPPPPTQPAAHRVQT